MRFDDVMEWLGEAICIGGVVVLLIIFLPVWLPLLILGGILKFVFRLPR